MNVAILQRASGFHAGIEPVDLAGRRLAVSVDGEIEQAHIARHLIERRAHYAGNVTRPTVRHFKDRPAHAGALHGRAGQQFDRAIALVAIAFDEQGACRQNDRHTACGRVLDVGIVGRFDRGIDGSSVVECIIRLRTVIQSTDKRRHADNPLSKRRPACLTSFEGLLVGYS